MIYGKNGFGEVVVYVDGLWVVFVCREFVFFGEREVNRSLML